MPEKEMTFIQSVPLTIRVYSFDGRSNGRQLSPVIAPSLASSLILFGPKRRIQNFRSAILAVIGHTEAIDPHRDNDVPRRYIEAIRVSGSEIRAGYSGRTLRFLFAAQFLPYVRIDRDRCLSDWVSLMDNLGRWDPLRLLGEEMGRMFEHLGLSSLHAARPFPCLNVYERGHRFLVLAELPGVAPDSIDVSVTGDTVTIRGERRREERVTDETFRRQERPFGRWERRITLPEEVIAEEVTADLENGILRIELPKAARARAQQIPVTARSPAARDAKPRAIEGPVAPAGLARPALPSQNPSAVRKNAEHPKS